ncbi:hypothetical protein chiPu_0007894 [Chiloscyllium punctatum]|uniref:Uncharacterized protein n=1 Tax=Chiloscyllium punctatum TaxID=137246 RepID=A0A401SG99_CHIPU|nr:hypothetical protein [Chiloscyllium punctatum]
MRILEGLPSRQRGLKVEACSRWKSVSVARQQDATSVGGECTGTDRSQTSLGGSYGSRRRFNSKRSFTREPGNVTITLGCCFVMSYLQPPSVREAIQPVVPARSGPKVNPCHITTVFAKSRNAPRWVGSRLHSVCAVPVESLKRVQCGEMARTMTEL